MAPKAESQDQRSGTWNLLRKLTGVAEPKSHLQGFTLRLGDGSCWWIAGIHSASYWAEKVATIMHLPEGTADGANLMVILEGKTPLEKVKRLVAPEPGWIALENNYVSVWYRRDAPDLLVALKPGLVELDAYLCIRFFLQYIFRQSIQRGGLPFHAALVEHHGKGILLAGASGAGKSTCCRRLLPPWKALCDDEVLLTLSSHSRYLAHPFPTWSDYFSRRGEKTYNVQHPLPLAGIFFMEQSSSDRYLPMNPSEALIEALVSAQVGLARLLLRCNSEEARDIRKGLFANVCSLAHRIPAFRLQVSLTGRFWEQMEAALTELQENRGQENIL